MTDRFEYYILEDGNRETKLRRLKVPGGWLVDVGGYRESSACFYPDPTHCWVVGETDPDHTCTKCGSNDLKEMTEFHKAFCYVQFGIDTNLFCYNCQSESVRKRLDNPIKSCDECEGTSTCPNSQAAFDAVKKNYRDFEDDVDDHTSVWGGAGPDCINGRLEAAQ